jgi:hypothetical protein
MSIDLTGRRGILISLDVLVVGDPTAPRPLDSAATALDRLGWIGRPTVLAGRELLGRRLPEDAGARVAWVRTAFGDDQLDVRVFDEPADRAGGLAERQAAERWAEARVACEADWLLTSLATSVGPARRARLSVVLIGPRGLDGPARVERADHEARDLLEAVSHLLTIDAFAARSG